MAVRKFLQGLSPRPPMTPHVPLGSGGGGEGLPLPPRSDEALEAGVRGRESEPTTSTVPVDAHRAEAARRDACHRIDSSREYFERILGTTCPGSTTEDFVRGLEDGRFLQAVANRVSGVLGHATSKLESIGIAGVSVDNFDRWVVPWDGWRV